MGNSLDVIGACQQLRRHEFLRALDWHFDTVGNAPGAVLHVVYEDPTNVDHYPSMSLDYDYVDNEAVKLADQAQDLVSISDALCDNLIKAAIALNELSKVKPHTYLSIRQLDYHIENFYVRVPVSVEHIYAMAACLFEMPSWERAPLWRLKKLVRAARPAVADSVAPLEALVDEVRETRNEVAHTGEFSDHRLSGIRGHLTASEMMGYKEFREHHPQLHKALVRFQGEFMRESQARLIAMTSAIATALDILAGEATPLLKLADEKMRAAWLRAPRKPRSFPDAP